MQGLAGPGGAFDDLPAADSESDPGSGRTEAEHLDVVAANPLARGMFHILRALSAAVFGDAEGLARHSAAAVADRRFVPGYPATLVHLLRTLALADQIRAARLGATAAGVPPGPAGDAGGDPVKEEEEARLEAARAELDAGVAWLGARAADAPGTFLHLARWATAEQAWAAGDLPAALVAFDEAAAAAAVRPRPWHRALIANRSAACLMAAGMPYAARRAIVEARSHYASWCATAAVERLEVEHPWLRSVGNRGTGTGSHRGTRGIATPARPTLTAGRSVGEGDAEGFGVDQVDMLAVLRACRALSSLHRVGDLQVALVNQVSAMTGATDVAVAVLDDDGSWSILEGDELLDPGAAAERGLLPVSAFRYVERTQQTLVVDDATADDRFAADPFLAELDSCSLLAVPIRHSGRLSAVLVAANRSTGGAFTAQGLDAVRLITGQLAVSLGNARLYSRLEARVAERTRELESANLRLEALSGTDPLTGLANRRRFEPALGAAWRRATDEVAPVCVVMVDVDHFKRFNDRYGHLAGDDCLRRVAQAMASASPGPTDLVCRYGGEEFVLLAPGADEEEGLAVGERVRAAVAALALPHELSGTGRVSVSVGVAALVPGPADDPGDLVGLADAALYLAKNGGRDQVRRPDR